MTTPSYSCLIDWDADGAFTEEGTRMTYFRVNRGKGSTLSGNSGYTIVDPGSLTILLDNSDDRYNPFNTGSDLYGYIKPNRAIRLKVTIDGITKNIFTGFIRDIIPGIDNTGGKTTRIIASDGIDWLQRQYCVRGDLETNYGVHTAIDALVFDAGWPNANTRGWTFPATFNDIVFGGSAIEDNGDTIPYWWADPHKTVWQEIKDISNAFIGDPFVATDGTFSYNARLYQSPNVLTLDQSQFLKDIEIQQPWKEVKNDISVMAYPRQATAAETDLWKLNDKPLIPASGSITIYADFQYSGEKIPASVVITPAATIDYTGGSTALLTDKTANISIVMTTYASSAKLVITNTDDTNGTYLTLMKIRGTGLFAQSGTACTAMDSTSQTDYGKQTMEIDSIWMQEINVAQNHATFAEMVFVPDRKVLSLRVQERADVQFIPDLFDSIGLTIAALEVSGDYVITRIEHEYRDGLCTTTWRAEPSILSLLTSSWIFPVTWNTNNVFTW